MLTPEDNQSKAALKRDRAWEKHAKNSSNETMRAFAGIASRMQLSMREVARRVGVDIKAFQGYFRSANPEVPTMERVAKALDYEPILARAFCGALTRSDINLACDIIDRIFYSLGERFFGDSLMTVRELFMRVTSGNKALLSKICADIIIASEGVPFVPHPILGPHFGAIEIAMNSEGASLLPYVKDERAIIERKLAARSWCILLDHALDLAPDDASEIRRIVGVYLDEPSSDPKRMDAEFVARNKAEEAYLESIRSGDTLPDDYWEVKVDPGAVALREHMEDVLSGAHKAHESRRKQRRS